MMELNLNTSLWIAGGAAIVLVVIYNFWQEYRAKKNVERAFGQHQDDVLMQTSSEAPTTTKREPSLRQEPTLSELDEFANTIPALPEDYLYTGDATKTPTVEDLNTLYASLGANVAASPATPALLDDFINCCITFEFDTPIRGEKILSETQSLRRVGNKAVQFVGVSSTGAQEEIAHAGAYTKIISGAQLVNRSGALNELEYSEWVMRLKQIADNLNGHLDMPDMKEVVEAGRDLHQFVTEHDVQLSVNVHTKSAPWAMPTLLAALTKHGFDARPNGRLAMSDGENGALYTLTTNAQATDLVTSRITLLLDVATVAPERGAFNAMIACAKSLSLRLGGVMVDDGNSPLDDATLTQIGQQLEAFYADMQAADIAAGSTRALKIFS